MAHIITGEIVVWSTSYSIVILGNVVVHLFHKSATSSHMNVVNNLFNFHHFTSFKHWIYFGLMWMEVKVRLGRLRKCEYQYVTGCLKTDNMLTIKIMKEASFSIQLYKFCGCLVSKNIFYFNCFHFQTFKFGRPTGKLNFLWLYWNWYTFRYNKYVHLWNVFEWKKKWLSTFQYCKIHLIKTANFERMQNHSKGNIVCFELWNLTSRMD